MAKGQVSEEELARGLKGIGNFGGLSSPRVRRDNPFRDSRSEAPAPEPVKTVEVTPLGVEQRVTKDSVPAPKIEPKVAARPLHKMPKTPAKEREEDKKREAASARKADVFTERVTLQISPEMRDDVERLARELQRAKVSKKERITGNTVMRVAIRFITERFELKPGEGPNDEEELFEHFQKALKKQ